MPHDFITYESLQEIARSGGPEALRDYLTDQVERGYPRRSAISAANKLFLADLIDSDGHGLICNALHQTKSRPE